MRKFIIGVLVALVLVCTSTGKSMELMVGGPAVPVDHGIPEPTIDSETLTWISPDGNSMLTYTAYPSAEIYARTRNSDTGQWSDLAALGIPHTTPTGIGEGYLSPDKNWCYYNVSEDPQLYRSQIIDGVWSTGTPVPGLSAGNYPSLNETQIYYASSSVDGGLDLYVADANGETPPSFVNAGAIDSILINTSNIETHPWISSDGLLLLFSSNRPGGYGGMDLYYSTRSDANGLWSDPINLGPDVNTASGEDVPRFAEQAGLLFFQRNDGYTGVHIMQATVVPEPSTLILFGAGAISLLAYVWRRRRHTA